jgi:hypothetical protein
MNTTHITALGIKYHAQIQTIDGQAFEFQPEHLMCDDCWNHADAALSHASYFGSCVASELDDNFKPSHSISVTKKAGK